MLPAEGREAQDGRSVETADDSATGSALLFSQRNTAPGVWTLAQATAHVLAGVQRVCRRRKLRPSIVTSRSRIGSPRTVRSTLRSTGQRAYSGTSGSKSASRPVMFSCTSKGIGVVGYPLEATLCGSAQVSRFGRRSRRHGVAEIWLRDSDSGPAGRRDLCALRSPLASIATRWGEPDTPLGVLVHSCARCCAREPTDAEACLKRERQTAKRFGSRDVIRTRVSVFAICNCLLGCSSECCVDRTFLCWCVCSARSPR